MYVHLFTLYFMYVFSEKEHTYIELNNDNVDKKINLDSKQSVSDSINSINSINSNILFMTYPEYVYSNLWNTNVDINVDLDSEIDSEIDQRFYSTIVISIIIVTLYVMIDFLGECLHINYDCHDHDNHKCDHEH